MNKQIPLEDLDFSVRTYNVLKRAGFYYAEELAACTVEELTTVKNLKSDATDEIQKNLSAVGLYLASETTGVFSSIVNTKVDFSVLNKILEARVEARTTEVLREQATTDPKFFMFEWFERPACIREPLERLTRVYLRTVSDVVRNEMKSDSEIILQIARQQFEAHWQSCSDECLTNNLPLSSEARSFLLGAGLFQLKDLLELKAVDLYDLPDVTDDLVDEIETVLASEGFSLAL